MLCSPLLLIQTCTGMYSTGKSEEFIKTGRLVLVPCMFSVHVCLCIIYCLCQSFNLTVKLVEYVHHNWFQTF